MNWIINTPFIKIIIVKTQANYYISIYYNLYNFVEIGQIQFDDDVPARFGHRQPFPTGRHRVDQEEEPT